MWMRSLGSIWREERDGSLKTFHVQCPEESELVRRPREVAKTWERAVKSVSEKWGQRCPRGVLWRQQGRQRTHGVGRLPGGEGGSQIRCVRGPKTGCKEDRESTCWQRIWGPGRIILFYFSKWIGMGKGLLNGRTQSMFEY